MREILYFNKKEEVLNTKEKKIIKNSLKSLNKLNALKAADKKNK